jgi:hypothetical protein
MLKTQSYDGRAHCAPASIAMALAPVALIVALSFLSASTKVTDEEMPKAAIADCQDMNAAHGRLACFDMQAKVKPPVPAKGGLAILSEQ